MSKTAKIILTCAVFLIAVGLGIILFVLNKPEEQDMPVSTVPTTATTTITTEATTEPTTVPSYDYVPSENGMTEKAKVLLKQNKDIAGWIKIEDTNVDYPFFKDPGEIPEGVSYYGGEAYGVNDFYLHHDSNRNYEFAGSLFMDYRDDFGGVEDLQSENIVIYGHNMANNTMFGSIRRYRQDYSFFEKSPFIQISSNYKDYDYVICGCIITSGNWYADFTYWNLEELDTKEDFDYYMDNVRAKQLFDTGVDVEYGDKLLTLSTCYANEDNSRFLVVARRLRKGESAEDLSTIERTEEYKKAHKSADN